MQNSHPLESNAKMIFFCLDSLIAHMQSTLSKAIGCDRCDGALMLINISNRQFR